MSYRFEVWYDDSLEEEADSLSEAISIAKDYRRIAIAEDWDYPESIEVHVIEVIKDFNSVDLGDYL